MNWLVFRNILMFLSFIVKYDQIGTCDFLIHIFIRTLSFFFVSIFIQFVVFLDSTLMDLFLHFLNITSAHSFTDDPVLLLYAYNVLLYIMKYSLSFMLFHNCRIGFNQLLFIILVVDFKCQ